MKIKDKLNYRFQSFLAYTSILFVYFLAYIYGTERVVKLGRKIMAKYISGMFD